MASNDQLVTMAIQRACEARGTEITKESKRQYVHAFQGTPAELIDRAFREIFATQENPRDMPGPGAVLAKVRAIVATDRAKRALPDVIISEADRKYGRAYIDFHRDYLEGKITRDQMYRGAVAAAKASGVGPDVYQAIEDAIGDWQGDHEFINRPGVA